MNNVNTEKKILVAFFSRADENYAVGKIEKGNTQIVAEMIAAEMNADTFHIETVKPYPADYNECIDVAMKEKKAKARPDIKGDVDITSYDVVFLGYPNWWGEMPMAVYTFIEKHDWHGKTVIPFCTHEGSGLSGTVQLIKEACAGAVVADGLAVKGSMAQNERELTLERVIEWLKDIR